MHVDQILELILDYRREKQEASADLTDIDVAIAHSIKAEAANEIYLEILHYLQGGD